MFNGTQFKPFNNRIWLSSPTMHGDELRYMSEAYESNWMSTVGKTSMRLKDRLPHIPAAAMPWP